MPARTTTLDRSDSRRRFIIGVATFLLVSVLVIRTSDAAFTATYTNDDNEFSTAEIDLDGSPDVPLFGVDGVATTDAINLVPGEISACIDIEYTGSLVAADLDAVDLTVSGATGALADELLLSVDVLDECGGTIANAAIVDDAAMSSVTGTVATGWTPAGDGDSRGFLFTVEVPDDDGVQGQSADDITFTWSLEASS